MHVWRANYQAAIYGPWSSRPGPHGYGWLCKPECGDDPTSHSSVEIQWMTPAAPGFVGPGQERVAHRVAPHSVADAAIAKDNLTEMKFVSAQTARISHTSKHHSLHTMTKRLVVTHDHILYCVVLLRLECWKECSSSFLYTRSLHALQHSTIYLSICT